MLKEKVRYYSLESKKYIDSKELKNKKSLVKEEIVPISLIQSPTVFEGDTFVDPKTNRTYTFKIFDGSTTLWEWGGKEYWYKTEITAEILDRLVVSSNIHDSVFPIWGA